MNLSLNEITVDDHLVVEVRGEVDVHSAPSLRDRLTDVFTDGHKIVIADLSELGFIDSTGLGALVAARNDGAARDAELLVVCSSERLLKLFRITGLDGVFSIYDSVAQAVQAPPGPTKLS
ncbi:MAG: anti-sigma factor antagonist [Frankiales bacterium]|nr:anti-sigma factor antagonist [Frankiales bacterium]